MFYHEAWRVELSEKGWWAPAQRETTGHRTVSLPGSPYIFCLLCGPLIAREGDRDFGKSLDSCSSGTAVSTFYLSVSGPAATAQLPSLPGFKQREEQRDWSSLQCLLWFFNKFLPRPYLLPLAAAHLLPLCSRLEDPGINPSLCTHHVFCVCLGQGLSPLI